MNNIEALKKLQSIRDELLTLYGDYKGNTDSYYKVNEHEYFKGIEGIVDDLESLSIKYLDNERDCFPIRLMEDVIINNNEIIELKTNITGLPLSNNIEEIITEGFLPSKGNISIIREDDELLVKLYLKNSFLQDKTTSYSKKRPFYNNINTIKAYKDGMYKIEKDTIIGVGYVKKEKTYKKKKK